ncbi:hypothetical protein ACFORJ_07665 [Corynebacterium hansenii]|uniref:Flavodoxin domain-containing protein n=1 Tax=Corynebacterium hansenii TaxID=394964 RepID=A0ABV7ZS44_9CORY|nr:hypothetical protein [Corynebacterium hansenii]WJZ00627.1 Flavodoxin domain protein [Corynebacterium hansenii]
MSNSAHVQPIVVVSNTRYGSTTEYAEEFARRTGGMLVGGGKADSPYADDELDSMLADRPDAPLIVFTPNYAGTFGGANLMKAAARKNPDRKMALAVIGMTLLDEVREKDPARAALDDVSERVHRHYLPGRLMFSVMSRKHRAVLWTMTRMIKGKKNPSPNERQMIDSYGVDTDRVDFAELDALVEWLDAPAS